MPWCRTAPRHHGIPVVRAGSRRAPGPDIEEVGGSVRILARLALVALLLGVLAVGALVYDQGEHVAIPGLTRDTVGGKVVDVIDGDTIDVAIDDVRTRVHLVGAVAPRPEGPDGPAECLAPEALATLKQLTPVGSRVLLRSVTANDDGSLTATVRHRLALVDAELVAAGVATASDAAIAGAPAAAARAPLPLPDPSAWLDGFEARAHADDLARVVDARAAAAGRHLGLYGVDAGCALPARVTAAINEASAAATLPKTTVELASLDVAGRTAALTPVGDTIAGLLAELDGDRSALPLRPFDDEQLATLRAQLESANQQLADAPGQFAAAQAASAQSLPEPSPAGDISAADPPAQAPPAAGGALTDASAPQAPSGATVPPPTHVGQLPNDPINNPEVIASLTYDAHYTGCRAYSGHTPDALDERNRPYAKIDCTTRQPIG